MKLIQYLVVAILGLSFSANAQKKKVENTLLWEISGRDLKKSSYLFGTYHFADKGFVDTMKVLNEKLKSADAIVGELLIDSTVAMKLMPYMMMKDTTLDRLLTPKEYQSVADYIKKISDLDLKLFNSMKPMAVQTLIIQFTAPKTFTETNPALDQYLQDYGRASQKAILGLETVEDQAKLLFGNNLLRQKELLLKAVKGADENKEEGKKIYNFYIAQDLTELEKLFAKSKDLTIEEWDGLLKNRNQKWMAALPELMQQQSLFIAVGAGHLVGADGLIKGLKAKGYTVKPLATN